MAGIVLIHGSDGSVQFVAERVAFVVRGVVVIGAVDFFIPILKTQK